MTEKKKGVVSMSNFTPEAFIALCEKFAKNRDQMHFHASAKVDKGNKLVINVDKCDEVYDKYIPTMKILMLQMAKQAISYACTSFQPSFAFCEKDFERLRKSAAEYVNTNMERYLQVLYDGSWEDFLDVVDTEMLSRKTAYFLENIKYQGGKWQLPDGSIYEDGAFIRNGERQYDAASRMLSTLIIGKAPIAQTAA